MIDVVMCRSILRKCSEVDALLAEIDQVSMVLRLRQHRMVVSEALMEYYEEYFEKEAPELLGWYQGICESMFYVRESAHIVSSEEKDKYIKGKPYLNELVSLCNRTRDKILLTDEKKNVEKYHVNKWGISVFDSRDMTDDRGSNLYSMYTLPVNGKQIKEGENSAEIAKWMGRFLEKEEYIQIFDNYSLTQVGLDYLRKYILKYVKEGTEIEIYSLEDKEFSRQQVKTEFDKKYYQKWKFSVYYVKSKKDLHARSIQGNHCIIQVERGLSVFGRNGGTFQTIVNLYENKNRSRIVVKESKIEQII